MEHFPALLTRAQSDTLVEHIEGAFERDGFGLWALELPGEAPFIGFTGLNRVEPRMPFAPAVEVGWRLGSGYWGRGLATEAARAAVQAGFGVYELAEVVSFTTVGNARSRAVMERLGMRRDPAEDFEHPRLPPGDALTQHVLYRLDAADGAEAG